jgi:PhzF family phenazine biosynthesis protein
MKFRLYHVDAFSDRLFKGNPAAVCPLESWLDGRLMQNIAAENNLSETAFYAREKQGWRIRWFSPKKEVDLCGHATLATTHVLFSHEGEQGNVISFNSRSGILKVRKQDDLLVLDFPADKIKKVTAPASLVKAVGRKPLEAFRGREDYMLVYKSKKDILQIEPDFRALLKTRARGVIITAPGKEADFVSRFFAPQFGINEDPATGSAHTTLTPYWSKRLNKTELVAHQLSERQGKMFCKMRGERVEIGGRAVTYLVGEITIPM